MAASFQKLPVSIVNPLIDSRCVRRIDQVIDKSEVSCRFFLHVTYIKDEQMLVFNIIFYLLWTGGGSIVTSVALLGFREIK